VSTNVNNPTNAPHTFMRALPWTTPRHIQLIQQIRNAGDEFNKGHDFKDEGNPYGGEVVVGRAMKPYIAHMPGITGFASKDEISALSHMDESAQGTHFHYQKQAIVVDVDARLITSSEEQLRKGIFREAVYRNVEEWSKSQQYRKMRESKILLMAAVKRAKKTVFKENSDEAQVVFSPMDRKLFERVNRSIERHLREAVKGNKRLKEDIFGDSFDEGSGFQGGSGFNTSSSFDSGFPISSNVGRPQDFTPLLQGPYNKQLYWTDYLDMHAKAFEAWTHNPVAKRICKVIPQFVLGKSVAATVISAEVPTGRQQMGPDGQPHPVVWDYRDKAQEILDDHWRRNSLRIESKKVLRDLVIFGEQFVRYYDGMKGLVVRQIDPSTVWEVVTDPDDCEREWYLHQQYPTRYQWYVDLPIPTIKFIIRQVPAKDYFHMKINTTAGEVRGRSELFAILGWLKRLKEFASDRVIRNKMANLFVLDVAVEGGQIEVTQAQQAFAQPPTPGSFFIHNKAAELQGIRAEVGAAEVANDWELLMMMCAVGAGISMEYLGLAQSSGSKAEALVGTEPDIKTFEDYQEIMEQFYQQDADRCFEDAKRRQLLPKECRIKVEMTYPEIAQENRSEKLKDIAFVESMSYISHERACSMSAKELSITTYNYKEEQEKILMEDAEREVKINAAYQQALKGQVQQQNGSSGGGGGGKTKPGSSGGGMLPKAGGSSMAPGGGNESEAGRPLYLTASKGSSYPSDPRRLAEAIRVESGDLRSKALNRLKFRQKTPDKTRDQKSMDRNDIVTKGRRAVHGNYNESNGNGKILMKPNWMEADEALDARLGRFRATAEALEPFKPGDGERLQNPRVHVTMGHQAKKMPTKRSKPIPSRVKTRR
jgi:hypothetical protein